ncbi:MAG TPA: ROK family protein, partial [Gemmatirosa sp.]
VDLAGTVRQRAHIDITLPTPDEALDLMATMAESLIARQGVARDRVCGVGVGVPGLMHPAPHDDGYVVTPTAFAGWHDVPLATRLGRHLDLPVLLENNATAAAVGERWYGAGRAIDTFFYVFLGSGLGGGLIIDGRPYEGTTGNAGELGYLLAGIATGPHAADEHVGLYFNVPRLFERLRTSGTDARTSADLAALFDANHPEVLAWMDTAATHLTRLVLTVEYLFDPEAIVLGGRLPERMLAGFLARVTRDLPAHRIGGKTTAPPFLAATAGADAAALGVATLPIHEFFAPAPQVLYKQGKRGQPTGLNAPRAILTA